jgi:preprotein translocase subunit SecE
MEVRAADGNMSAMSQTAKLRQDESNGSSLNLPGPLQRVGSYPERLKKFIHEVRLEMRQVNWPSRLDVISTTVVVIITVAFFGLFFFFVDRGASWFIETLLKLFKH